MNTTITVNLLTTLLMALSAVRSAYAVDQSVIAAQERRVRVIQQVAPSVVAIFGNGGAGGGSGVIITPDGYALSNFHVTSGAGDFMKCGLNDGVLYDAVIVGIDPTGDVALVKLLGRDDFPTAPLGDSDQVRVGDWAYAMGNPFLLATDFQPTVTYGIVSGSARYPTTAKPWAQDIQEAHNRRHTGRSSEHRRHRGGSACLCYVRGPEQVGHSRL